MFTDNFITFGKATKKVARNVNHIMDHYYKIPGQSVNYHKSKV